MTPTVDELLTRAYGFAPPTALVQWVETAVSFALDHGRVDGHRCINALDFVFYLDGPACEAFSDGGHQRLLPQPVEMFVFGSPQVDGIQYGLLIHAPELGLADHPVVELCPRGGGEAPRRLAAYCREGFEVLMSRALAGRTAELAGYSDGPRTPRERLERFEVFARAVGVEPDALRGRACCYDPALPTVTPDVPPGWRFEPAVDGVGVLAPAALFAPASPDVDVDVDADCDLSAVVAAARRHLADGHPASALLVARAALFENWYIAGCFETLRPVLERAYLDLGRPLLADQLSRYATCT